MRQMYHNKMPDDLVITGTNGSVPEIAKDGLDIKERKRQQKFKLKELDDYVRGRIATVLRDQGYNVYHEYQLPHGGRVDVLGRKGNEVIYVELKKGTNHEVFEGVGQLLYYQHFDPKAKLMIAVPADSIRADEALLSFLEKYRIALRQISKPEGRLLAPDVLDAKCDK